MQENNCPKKKLREKLEIMEKQKPSAEDDPLKKLKEIFWKQLQASLKSNPKTVRWHPMIIKLCLFITSPVEHMKH